jgi:hypothetical protein
VASYVPVTIDTSQVTLGSDLEALVERLAKNNHNHGPGCECTKAVVSARSETTARRGIPTSCRTHCFRNRRRNSIERPW